MNVKNAGISHYAVVVDAKEHEKTETIARATKLFLMLVCLYSEHLLLRKSKQRSRRNSSGAFYYISFLIISSNVSPFTAT